MAGRNGISDDGGGVEYVQGVCQGEGDTNYEVSQQNQEQEEHACTHLHEE